MIRPTMIATTPAPIIALLEPMCSPPDMLDVRFTGANRSLFVTPTGDGVMDTRGTVVTGATTPDACAWLARGANSAPANTAIRMDERTVVAFIVRASAVACDHRSV